MRIKSTACAATVLFATLSACRGGGLDPYEQPHNLPVTVASATVSVDLSGYQGGVNAQPLCPTVTAMPFETTATAFNDSQAAQALIDAGTHSSGTVVYGHYLRDSITNPGQEQVISGQATYGVNYSSVLAGTPPEGLAGEYVSLWFKTPQDQWIMLARVLTDDNGQFEFRIPPDKAFGVGRWAVYAVVEGDQSCASGGVFVYPAGTQIIVTDIDETLTRHDEEVIAEINDPNYVEVPHHRSNELMQNYEDKGYIIFYLTARSYHLRNMTRKWLVSDDLQYPFSFLETAEKLVFSDSAVAYKTAFIRKLIQDLGYDVVLAHGNATSDIDAYQNNQIPNDRIFIIGVEAGEKGTVPINALYQSDPEIYDYSEHIENFQANLPAADQPF